MTQEQFDKLKRGDWVRIDPVFSTQKHTGFVDKIDPDKTMRVHVPGYWAAEEDTSFWVSAGEVIRRVDTPEGVKTFPVTDEYTAVVYPEGEVRVGCQSVNKDGLHDLYTYLSTNKMI